MCTLYNKRSDKLYKILKYSFEKTLQEMYDGYDKISNKSYQRFSKK